MIMQRRVAISLAVVKQQLLSEELCAIGQWKFMNGALFFLKVILYTFFLFLLIYGGLEVGVLGEHFLRRHFGQWPFDIGVLSRFELKR